ncbi:hypothetical protein F4818DRAFT_433851 [Hypoxylon cercidicola]|nr:hypothetical protein F4818DRAFT_433851 [Hypoxylon cercidicola]
MMVPQDYTSQLRESFDYSHDFVPNLQPLPRTANPFDLGMNSYPNSFSQFNGVFPSPQTPTYPVDPHMYSAGSTFTPRQPTFNRTETQMIPQAIPFTPQGVMPYQMSFGSLPDTPETSPTLLQQGQASQYQAPTNGTKPICEVDNISSPADTPLIKRRTRARETCNNCRKEHRACDSKKPRCTRCEMYSKGSCCYDRVPKRRGRKPKPTKPLPDHILGAVIRSNPQLEYAIIHELQNGTQPDTDINNCDYLEQDSVRPGLMDTFKSSSIYKLIYGDDDAKAEVSASATIFGAHLESGTSFNQNEEDYSHLPI